MSSGATNRTGIGAASGARPQPSSDRPERRRSTDATFAAAEPGVPAAALPFCQAQAFSAPLRELGLRWSCSRRRKTQEYSREAAATLSHSAATGEQLTALSSSTSHVFTTSMGNLRVGGLSAHTGDQAGTPVADLAH